MEEVLHLCRPSEDGYSTIPASIGCTAEVLAVKEESDDRSGLSRMRVKAIGRQRFEVIKHQRQIDGYAVLRTTL